MPLKLPLKNLFSHLCTILLDFHLKICYTISMTFFNEELCLNPNADNEANKIKTYNRWPTKHRKELFGDRLAMLMSMVKNNEDPHGSLFLHSRVYFIRAALESKFNRHFPLKEINRIINDLSWQTSKPTSQPLSNEKEEALKVSTNG